MLIVPLRIQRPEHLKKRDAAQRGRLMGFLWVDGHVRAYHGHRTISRAFVPPPPTTASTIAQATEHSGEVVALFVARKDPSLTEKDIIDHCRQSLSAYKIPKHVYFRAELPKTNVGKVLRKALREELAKV